MFSIQIDVKEINANFPVLRTAIRDAISNVSPVFGAFMPYSIYAEYGNAYYGPQPSVEPSLIRNNLWILQNYASAMMPLLDKAVKSRSVAGLDAKASQVWENILNDKPAKEAKAMARYRTGMHRQSIAGYGNEKSLSAGIKAADKMNAMRGQALSRLRKKRV